MKILSILRLALLAASLAFGQTAAPSGGFAPSEDLNRELPPWLRFSADYRTRLEGADGIGFKTNNQDMYLLSRLRFGTQIAPVRWFKIVAQAQDARIFFNDRVAGTPPYQDTLDLRLAYVELGNSEGPVVVRAGRQELDFGDQRLIGTSNWLNVPRMFDAVRATFRHGGYRLDAFASSIVAPLDGTFDHHQEGNNLHGLYGGLEKLVPRAVIEPYVLWRVAPRQKNEDGKVGSLDTKTGGVRWVGKLPLGFDYGMEMALQAGNIGGDSLRAWAGHWVGGYTFTHAPYTPRVFAEYNYASGDRDPRDGHMGTFDQLYPTGHDKYGLADQVGWRNIRDLHFGVEARPARRVTAAAGLHSWRLASATDGLYNAAGAMIARVADGSAGTRVGDELDAQAMYKVNRQMSVGAGVGHIFPGEFLKRATQGNPYTYPYLMLGYAF